MHNGNRINEVWGLVEIVKIFRNGNKGYTRADIGHITGLARSTIVQRLDTLLDLGLIVPDGESTSTGGRPPGQFRFNISGGVLLMADIGASHLRCTINNLAGEILSETASSIEVADGPEVVLTQVAAAFEQLLKNSEHRAAEVRGIGVNVPGPVEFATGRPVSPPIMPGWDGFNIPGYFEEVYNCPTLVDNDVNAMAFGEQRQFWQEHRHMLLIKIGTGIGCGIIANNEIHRGAQGSAGDLGHISYIGETGPLCRCGNINCVEANASGWALVRDLRELGYPVNTSKDVVNLIRSGQPDAVRLARQAGRVLGYAVSDAVSFFNPSLVVIGGSLANAEEPLLAGIREVVYRRSLPLATRDLQITRSRLGGRAGVIGLALMVGDHIYNERLKTG